MLRVIKWTLWGLICLQLGCATTVLTKENRTNFDRNVQFTHHIALFGLWEISDPILIKSACGLSDWSKVESSFTPMNIVVGALTLGFYTPATVTISCHDLQSRK